MNWIKHKNKEILDYHNEKLFKNINIWIENSEYGGFYLYCRFDLYEVITDRDVYEIHFININSKIKAKEIAEQILQDAFYLINNRNDNALLYHMLKASENNEFVWGNKIEDLRDQLKQKEYEIFNDMEQEELNNL